jgi:ribosome recycling factor
MLTFNFEEGAPLKHFEQHVQEQMDKHIDHFQKENSKLRTGRANPAMVEDLKVNAYGSIMSLKEIAAISAPEPQLLSIQPWDKSLIPDVEKALTSSSIGITPRNDGNVIRLQMPSMTQERRKDLIKVLGQKLEACKVAIRNARKDILNSVRSAEKSKDISEDYSKRLQDALQKVTDNFITQADHVSQAKEQEIKG